jgi:hypothetical protein
MLEDDQKDMFPFQQPTEVFVPYRLPQHDLHLETPSQKYPEGGQSQMTALSPPLN